MTKATELKEAIVDADTERAEALTTEILQEQDATEVLDEAILPAADTIGEYYETGEFFLTDLMRCGDTLEAVMGPLTEALNEQVATTGEKDERVTIVLATIKEDIHDIGKNLVRLFLAGNGHHVHDMGVDKPEDEIVDRAIEENADVIALSALMSITRDNMQDVIRELEDRGLRDEFKVLVGGRSANANWAEKIGADGYAPDAPQSVGEAERLWRELEQEAKGGA
ncbi:MAG: cobalamin-dependent protein [Halodesulfurarchaeum sp.]|nr:cobalamin-dependent protein [Halodesulfurarchaeum sp.]